MVSTLAPSSEAASTRQPRTILPSTRTVQAPHTPCSQPVCEPIRPRSRRRKSIRCRRASTRRATRSPLTVREMSTSRAHAARASSRAGEAPQRARQQHAGEMALHLRAAVEIGGRVEIGIERGLRRGNRLRRRDPAGDGAGGALGADRPVADAEEDQARLHQRAAGELRLGDDAGHGVVAGAPGQLQDDAALARLGDGKFDGRDQLVGGERGGIEAGEELRCPYPPLARGGARDDGGLERHAAGRQLGGGVGEGERAADGAAVADGGMGDQGHGLRQQRHVPAYQLAGAQLRVRRQRADADRVAGLRNAFQLGHARDVDQRAGVGQPERQRRQQRLPTGQQLGLRPRRAPQPEHIGQRGRPDIGERRRLHE